MADVAGGTPMSTAAEPDPSPWDRRDLRLLLLALVGGLAWGAATSGLQTVLPFPWSSLANAASPWVTAAFVAGVFAQRLPVAVAAGVLVCLGETLGYYGTSALRGFGVGAWLVVWLVAALPGGSVFGAAGCLWRHAERRWSALGAALLAAVFLAEGVVVFAVVHRYTAVAVVFGLIGIALAVGLGARGRRIPAVLAWCVLTIPLGVLGELAVVGVLG